MASFTYRDVHWCYCIELLLGSRLTHSAFLEKSSGGEKTIPRIPINVRIIATFFSRYIRPCKIIYLFIIPARSNFFVPLQKYFIALTRKECEGAAS